MLHVGNIYLHFPYMEHLGLYNPKITCNSVKTWDSIQQTLIQTSPPLRGAGWKEHSLSSCAACETAWGLNHQTTPKVGVSDPVMGIALSMVESTWVLKPYL